MSAPELHHIAEAVGHPGVGGEAVAPGAAGLLMVGLEAFRRVEVRDEADVGLVDPHAEGDRGDDDDPFLLAKAFERPPSHRALEAGVIGERLDAVPDQELGRRFDLGAREAIDDARVVRMLVAHEREQLPPAAVVLVDHAVAQVRAVEAGDEDPRVAEREALDDLAPGRRVGGRGERDPRHAGKTLGEKRQPQVLGSEVVSPLRDAVRFVDREERDPGALEEGEKALGEQPLGRDVEQVELARDEAPLDDRPAAGRSRLEFRTSAATPSSARAVTWSCISAMSGETTIAVPGRASAGIW